MPEKVKKPAKPTTNLLQNIRSPRPSQIDENVPKSKHYRSELEPLLGAAITLKCPDWTIFHEEHYTKILLKAASVMKAPSGRCVPLPIAVDHVWVAVDLGWERGTTRKKAVVYSFVGLWRSMYPCCTIPGTSVYERYQYTLFFLGTKR